MVFEKKVVFAFLFLMSVGLVSSAVESDTLSDFNVDGCVVDGIHIPLDTCSEDGGTFCSDDGEGGLAHNTRSSSVAVPGGEVWCANGATSYSSGDAQCCPTGFTCNDASGNCELNVALCSSETTQGGCDGVDHCYWIEHPTSPFCSDRPQDFSCSVYGNNE